MKQIGLWFSKGSIRNILAIIITLGCFILLYVMVLKPIPVENKDPLNIALGFVFGGALAGVVGYFFGSSKNETDAKKEEK